MKNKKKLIIIFSVVTIAAIACIVTFLIINNNPKDNSIPKEETTTKEEKIINFELKEFTILEDEEYTIDSFIDKDKSDSNLTYSFESEEMATYKEVGEYTIRIVATDDSNNETVKETKLIIEKKEVNNETSNQTQEKFSTNNNTQPQPTTPAPAPQPAQELYYGLGAPYESTNPPYLFDTSEETYRKMIGSRESFLSKDVSLFNAQGPTVSTWGERIAWSKTKDWLNPDGYQYKVYIYNCKRVNSAYTGDPNNKPEVTNPTYNTYTYKGDDGGDCGRLIGEYYYTDTNGSKAWEWNPNNLHF